MLVSLRKSDAIPGNYFVRVVLKQGIYETPISYPEKQATALLEREQKISYPPDLLVDHYSGHKYFKRVGE